MLNFLLSDTGIGLTIYAIICIGMVGSLSVGAKVEKRKK